MLDDRASGQFGSLPSGLFSYIFEAFLMNSVMILKQTNARGHHSEFTYHCLRAVLLLFTGPSDAAYQGLCSGENIQWVSSMQRNCRMARLSRKSEIAEPSLARSTCNASAWWEEVCFNKATATAYWQAEQSPCSEAV